MTELDMGAPARTVGLARVLDDQRAQAVLWMPVFLAMGIGAYLWLPRDPAHGVFLACGIGGGLALVLTRLAGSVLGPLLFAVGLFALGLGWIGLRAHAVATPVLEFRYYGPIEGRVVAIDRSASDRLRVTLDRVRLAEVPAARTPGRVRVSFHGPEGTDLVPGRIIGLTGHLSPPSGPVEPGGYDFQRDAWFKGLGAVGYSRAPPVLLAAPEGRALWIGRVRQGMSAHIRAVMPEETGGVAAALTTGDRSGIRADTLEDLRRTNLAHLLAISGLHMGIWTALVFGTVRFGLAAIPTVAVTWPVKKIAAATAIVAGAGYLWLSGSAVATERAFVMAVVIFGAVLVERQAITLRSVAVAALVILALTPEALYGPGFQMSFAATTALVVVFGLTRWRGERPRAHVLVRWIAGIATASLIAGLATAPFGAAHFNQISSFGFVANVLAVPLMGTVVMPGALISLVLAPLGGEAVGLWIMDLGLRWILGVAHMVASWQGAVVGVASPGPGLLPLFVVGALIFVLWHGPGRWVGLGLSAAALVLWSVSTRPDLLIDGRGDLIGWQSAEGRVLNKPRGSGFVAEVWLENDGDIADQEAAAARTAPLPRQLADLCPGAEDGADWRACLDPGGQAGAIALRLRGPEVRITTARDVTGARLWNDADLRARALGPQ